MKRRLKLLDQQEMTRLKTRSGAGAHRPRKEKRKPPRAVAKRRAWLLEDGEA